MRYYFHTNGLGGHWNELVVLKGRQLQLLPFVLCRVARNDKFLPAHVPSHHVAQSQNGTVLCFRALDVTNTRTTFLLKLENTTRRIKDRVKSRRVYVVVFANFDEVPNGQLQLIASHGADHQGVKLSCQLSHVLFVCVHQTLGNRKQVLRFKLHRY